MILLIVVVDFLTGLVAAIGIVRATLFLAGLVAGPRTLFFFRFFLTPPSSPTSLALFFLSFFSTSSAASLIGASELTAVEVAMTAASLDGTGGRSTRRYQPFP